MLHAPNCRQFMSAKRQQVKKMFSIALKRTFACFVLAAIAWTFSSLATTEAFSETTEPNPPDHRSLLVIFEW